MEGEVVEVDIHPLSEREREKKQLHARLKSVLYSSFASEPTFQGSFGLSQKNPNPSNCLVNNSAH